MNPPRENYVGRSIGSYRLLTQLGSGGFGSVYLAEHKYLSAQAAVKIIHSPLMDVVLIKQFFIGADVVAKFNHPHILPVLDYGIEDDILYVVAEYTPNGSLRGALLKRKALPLETILSYTQQIAQALQYAHDRNIVHRDLKPENILFGNDGKLSLVDFDFTPLFTSVLTRGDFNERIPDKSTQCPSRTPAYMAPEQLQGFASPRSDQYSLGVIVYELLMGNLPPLNKLFSTTVTPEQGVAAGDRETAGQERRYKQSNDMLHPATHHAIEQVLLKALAVNPTNRYENVAAFAAALQAAAMGKQRLTRKHSTKQYKDHARGWESPEYATHAQDTTYDDILQENDTLPILTKCLAKPYIEQAFACLPWLERNCLLLYTDEEFTQEDIAAILSLDKKAVRSRLERASQLWLQAYDTLVEKDLGISLTTLMGTTLMGSALVARTEESILRVKRLIQAQNH